MNGSCIDYTVKLRQQNAPQWIKMEKNKGFHLTEKVSERVERYTVT